jgi:hypothetical protein
MIVDYGMARLSSVPDGMSKTWMSWRKRTYENYHFGRRHGTILVSLGQNEAVNLLLDWQSKTLACCLRDSPGVGRTKLNARS